MCDINKIYVLKCPHCQDYLIINKNEINCCIFRHAINKNGSNFNPHASISECIYAKENDLIYGCGKPFKFDKESEELIICDYL